MRPTKIQTVPLQDCLMLRHKVLWPNKPLEASRVSGDESAAHYGIRKDEQLICCLSVFKRTDGLYQIRKFATDHAFQGQGYGSSLLTSVLTLLSTDDGMMSDGPLDAELLPDSGMPLNSTVLLNTTALLNTKITVTLDARLSAHGFYKKFGFITQGNVFKKREVEYIRMVKPLSC